MFESKLGGKMYLDAVGIYRDVSRVFPPQGNNWTQFGQFFRALGSIVANVAEANGKSKDGAKYYQNLMLHARGSTYEAVAWLELAVIDGLVSEVDARVLGGRLMALSDSIFEEVLDVRKQ